jgi:hypothetical protein
MGPYTLLTSKLSTTTSGGRVPILFDLARMLWGEAETTGNETTPEDGPDEGDDGPPTMAATGN